MTLHPYVNLGIAVDLDQQGLVVPVLRDADGLNMRGIAKGIATMANSIATAPSRSPARRRISLVMRLARAMDQGVVWPPEPPVSPRTLGEQVAEQAMLVTDAPRQTRTCPDEGELTTTSPW